MRRIQLNKFFDDPVVARRPRTSSRCFGLRPETSSALHPLHRNALTRLHPQRRRTKHCREAHRLLSAGARHLLSSGSVLDLGLADRLALGFCFGLALRGRFGFGNLWINKRREREILPVDIQAANDRLSAFSD